MGLSLELLCRKRHDWAGVDKDNAKFAAEPGKDGDYEPGPRRSSAQRHEHPQLQRAAKAVRGASIVFIAVARAGEDGSAIAACPRRGARGARAMNGYKVIVNKSTVPVGTSVKVREAVRRETTHPFSVVSNPEFLKQGAAIDDFMKPDRVVVGAEDPRAKEIMMELYTPFTRTGAPIMMMDGASAEMANTRRRELATRIPSEWRWRNVCEWRRRHREARAGGSDTGWT